MILDELFESSMNILEGRDASLYHGTPLSSFFEIMKSDELRGWVTADSFKTQAIRTSRDINVAKDFAMKDGYYYGVVIELDQAKIASNYKIIPYADDQVEKQRVDGHSESEEIIVTPVLKPLSKYMTAFYISNADLDDIIDDGDIDYWSQNAIEHMVDTLKIHPLRKPL